MLEAALFRVPFSGRTAGLLSGLSGNMPVAVRATYKGYYSTTRGISKGIRSVTMDALRPGVLRKGRVLERGVL